MEVTTTASNFAVVNLGPSVEQNKFTFEFLSRLNEALDLVLRMNNIKGMITTATGKFFSNGIDLEFINSLSSGERNRFFGELHRTLLRIMVLPFPTIAAVNGHAFAAGAFLALAHDYCVMSNTRGWLCFNEVHVRLPFNAFLMEFLRLKIPPGAAMTEAVILGRRYTAEKAYKDGIVQAHCDITKLMDTTVDIISKAFVHQYFDRDTMGTIKKQVYEKLLQHEHSKL